MSRFVLCPAQRPNGEAYKNMSSFFDFQKLNEMFNCAILYKTYSLDFMIMISHLKFKMSVCEIPELDSLTLE